MHIKVELTPEQASEVMRVELTDLIDTLEQYLEEYALEEPVFVGAFDIDPDKDVKEIKKHIKSAKRILSYYQ